MVNELVIAVALARSLASFLNKLSKSYRRDWKKKAYLIKLPQAFHAKEKTSLVVYYATYSYLISLRSLACISRLFKRRLSSLVYPNSQLISKLLRWEKCQVPSASVRIFPSCVVKHPTHTLAASKAHMKRKREPTFTKVSYKKTWIRREWRFQKFIVLRPTLLTTNYY